MGVSVRQMSGVDKQIRFAGALGQEGMQQASPT